MSSEQGEHRERRRNKKLFVASLRSQEGPLGHREPLETSQQLLRSIMMAREYKNSNERKICQNF